MHYVLKGLKTLSRSTYDPPPPTDFVLIDYDDSATFDAVAGYYHPTMKTVDGRVIPSSDRLLHEFLKRCPWVVSSSSELTLLRQNKSAQAQIPAAESPREIVEMGTGTTLTSITKSGDQLPEQPLEIRLSWNFQSPREVFPWMFLKLTSRDRRNVILISKGLCAPEAASGPYQESWRIAPSDRIPEGDYGVEALFVDNTRRVWAAKSKSDPQSILLSAPVALGELRVAPGKRKSSRD